MADARPRRSRSKKRTSHKVDPQSNNGDKRSKVNLPKSDLQLQGTICKVYETGGFIKPMQALPEIYSQSKNVYFHANSLSTALWHVKENDHVEFTLNVYNPDKPSASNVYLIKCSARSTKEIEHYLHETEQFLLNCNSDVSESDGRRQCFVISLLRCTEIWNCIGSDNHISDGTVERIMSIMLILEEHKASLEQSFENILQVLSRTPFLNVFNGRLLKYIHKLVKNGNSLKTVKDFLFLLMNHLPSKSMAVLHLVQPFLESSQCDLKYVFSLLKECANFGNTAIEDMEWDELPIVPDINEYLDNDSTDQVHLRPVRIKGPYGSPQEYMDTYFRLLRADCFSALCEGIKCFLNGMVDHRNINIYHSVSLVAVNVNPFDSSALILAMNITPYRKVSNWKKSSSLMFGNLLALSASGTFKDVIWAIVVNRDDDLLKSKQVIMVEVCSEANSMSDVEALAMLHRSSGRILMVESPTYYRAFQPILRALQKMEVDRMAFKDHLVEAKMPTKPDFITETTTVDGSVIYSNSSSDLPIFELLKDCESFKTNLDDSQKEAITKSIIQNIAIIQGPPGTGKTFIGLKIIRLLLSMSTRPNSPILVLTYKNHALDEFLNGLSEWFPEDIVRVGGRSSNERIVGYNLNELKRQYVIPQHIRQELGIVNADEQVSQNRVMELLRNLKRATNFSEKCFLENATVSQMRNLFLKVDWDRTNATFKVSSQNGKCVDKLKLGKELAKVLVKEEIVNKEFFLSNQTLLRKMINYWLPDKKVITSVEKASNLLYFSQERLEKLSEGSENEGENGVDERDIEALTRERLFRDYKEKRYTLDKFVPFEKSKTFYDIHLFPTAKALLNNIPTIVLEKVDDLCRLSASDRVKLLQLWLLRQVNEAKEALAETLAEYERVCQVKKKLQNQHLTNIMAGKRIIGMTITGASIHQNLLAIVRPAIVIVEEAAEVLEPQLVAALGDWVQQLILIGDHKQLRPLVESYKLRKDLHFDISMMERLINNDFPYSTLKKQNRMRPEFAELLLDIYPELQSNMARVKDNKSPKCVRKSMFFWSHTDTEMGGRSYTNEGEAERIVQLTLFLLIHEYKPNQISILSAYQGQTSVLRRMIRDSETKYPELFQISWEPMGNVDRKSSNLIQVQTIDNYQGDENDVVLVSLVRSNEKKITGFVKLQNRRCVAQSRARCCMVFVGNKETIGSAAIWNTLLGKMEAQGCVGNSIELCCPRHNNVSFFQAREGKDVQLGNFCNLKCTVEMPCNVHICGKPCQPNHTHRDCKATVEFTFAICNHPGKRYCYQKEANVRCEKEVLVKLKKCGHIRMRLCYQDEDQVPCLEKCGQEKPCSHQCQERCQSQHDHDVCNEIVSYTHPMCNHVGKKKCTADPNTIQCREKVKFKFLKCSHNGYKKCYESIDSMICREKCTRKVPDCNHLCQLTCGEACDPKKCVECKEIEKVKEKLRKQAEAKLIKKAREEAKKDLDDLRKKDVTNECVLTELKDQGGTAAEYFDVADKVRKYIQPDHQWYPIVRKIEKVQNLKLLEKHLEAKCEMFDPSKRSELKFHGTSVKSVKGIIRNGFQLPAKGGMFGKGIYFATDSSKSAQKMYTKGSKMLLLCEVLLGRTKTVYEGNRTMNKEKLQGENYDSIFARRGTQKTKGVKFDEFVIYNPGQALPKYIIHYESSSFDQVRLKSLANNFLALETKSVKKYTIKAKREISFEDPLEMHYRLAESQYLRLKKDMPDIDFIEYYINPELVKKFNRKQVEMEKKYSHSDESKVILAFHGTKETNISSIVQHNFSMSNLGKSTGNMGLYGAGIYFSEFPDISSGYGNSLLLCCILPGKSYDCPKIMNGKPCNAGYDSHRFQKDKEGRGRELVIFNEDQILPSYVINMK